MVSDSPSVELVPSPKGISLQSEERILEMTEPTISAYFGVVGIVLTVFSMGLYAIVPFAARREYEYVVTNKRIVKRKNGFFGGLTREIPIEKVYEIKTVGSPIGKLFGKDNGSVIFETKEDDVLTFSKVANPEKIADTVQQNHSEGIVRNSAGFD